MCLSVWSSSGTRLCTLQPIIISSVWPCPICSTCSWVGLIKVQFVSYLKRTYLDLYSAYRTAGRGISLLASVSIFVWAAILQTASIRIGSVSRILCRIIICLNRVYDFTDAPMFRFLQSSPSRWSDFWPSAIHCMCAKCLASRERRKLLQPFGS